MHSEKSCDDAYIIHTFRGLADFMLPYIYIYIYTSYIHTYISCDHRYIVRLPMLSLGPVMTLRDLRVAASGGDFGLCHHEIPRCG